MHLCTHILMLYIHLNVYQSGRLPCMKLIPSNIHANCTVSLRKSIF
uniref:Uncharacterized protein n=1 Tax=Anguilla anguilla TaxID=7936 RepID=A0A0E9RF65_ANGAN